MEHLSLCSIQIDYDEKQPNSYRGINITQSQTGKILIEFNSGNFLKDWMSHKSWLMVNSRLVYTYESSVENYLLESHHYLDKFLH